VHPLRQGARVSVQMLTRRGWATVAWPRLTGHSAFETMVVPRVAGQYLFRVAALGAKQRQPRSSTAFRASQSEMTWDGYVQGFRLVAPIRHHTGLERASSCAGAAYLCARHTRQHGDTGRVRHLPASQLRD
jgi:hypothetical protein